MHWVEGRAWFSAELLTESGQWGPQRQSEEDLGILNPEVMKGERVVGHLQ